ncbi:iron-siderophore ABC transporter substrate-binding protein [Actinoplanes rectilineatus]|uniref:ABC transporter substrate-binding protein n=1 Tax=Actinoplanes rectilineatus TaxID=113571 RepID=UPI0005F2C519|nr:iron-siderophore ABC transporter substrate-binding protein [Actinoplanes rectilineatus]
MRTNLSRRALVGAVTAAVTAVALSACGTTEETAETEASTAVSAGPVDLTDERGAVHLDAPATKVVSLEWGPTETLLALGVKPVGAADVKGYNTYDTQAPLDAATADLGTRGEPSLDAIMALTPDLVVTTVDLPENVIKQIADQVPVIAIKGSDGADPIGYMRKTVTLLAQATGTTTQGEKLLADFDAKITEGKAALATAGKTGAPFTMADGWLQDGTVALRMYTPGSFFGAVAKELGLTNQWTEGGDKDYGLAQTDIEGLTKITNADSKFVYVANQSEGGKEFEAALTGNAVWKTTPFGKASNTDRIPDGIWMFGSVPSANAYADALIAAFTGK